MTKEPVVDVVTLTLMVQLAFAAMVPLENESEVAPTVGANVGVPQLVVVALGGFATVIFAGRGSVKLYPVMALRFGFVSVIVNAEIPLRLVGFGLKLLVMVTLVGSTMLA